MVHKHVFEFDEQAGVSQCIYCGYVRYVSKKKKYGWTKSKKKAKSIRKALLN